MDTGRNLLFGVLALQADLIDPQQFIEACLLWTSRKDVPLAEVLVERGWILPADRAHVDYLLERKLHKHGGDPRASLANIPDDVKRCLATVGDDEVHRSLADLPVPEQAGHQQATVDHVAGPHERYARLRLHATGGIGRVWVAHDGDLGRDVALKELRPERAEHAALWVRFLQEARITGQLEHPGVVPVYELARRRDDQQPFYTMRFVKGRTLSEAARVFHDKRLAGQADALDLPVLLNAFVTVCNTVAYAHSRGVIHRDLKGQNVVLGDFGEVVVLDWGLAKRLGQPDGAPAAVATSEDPGAADSGQTVQGQALGTPAYMAPEQAAGRLELIDRRTDVYGLGAVLYEILTGQPPFAGPDTLTVLRKVQEEEPAPPRHFWPDVPAALGALCLRALAKDPADRPAAAAELAQEVQGWQEFERRKAEEALRESEALYHSLVENLPCVVLRKDLEGRWTFANHRCCEFLGRPLNQLLGKTDLDIYPPGLTEKYRRDDRQVMETGGVLEDIEEVVVVGGRRYVHVLKTAVRDAAGKVTGVQAIGWDVTERKLAEEELRKSRERFELAVQGSQDGLWDWDLTTDEVYYSPRYKAMLGYEDHEFPNCSEEWAKRVHPDDLDRVRSDLRAHFKGTESLSWVEFRMRHKDGSYRWIRSRAFVLRDPSGRVYRMAGSHEDITDRKTAAEELCQSEERYRSVIAAMQDGIVLLDADGGIRECNAAAERILGLSAGQMMGRTPHDPRWRAIREDGRPFPGEMHPPMVTLRTGQPCTDVVMGVHKPDGTLTWITVNAQPLFQADGRTLAGVVASFEDVTERKQTEAALRQTADELTCSRQQLQRLTAREGRHGPHPDAAMP
jgi:PAS domain S-box-containing protein